LRIDYRALTLLSILESHVRHRGSQRQSLLITYLQDKAGDNGSVFMTTYTEI
jgi:cytochrome c oxidase subunit IV